MKYTNGKEVIDVERFDPHATNYAKYGITAWTPEEQPRDSSWGYLHTRFGEHHITAGEYIITYSTGTRDCMQELPFKMKFSDFKPMP